MVEKTFKDYLLLASKEYSYRLKFAFDLSEDKLQRIEKACQKYSIVDISKPNRITFQKTPLDFKNVENTEVYFIDVVFAYPASTELFHQELRQALNVAENLVIVRCENDPYEQEIIKQNDYDEKQEKGEYVTKLEDPMYKSDGIEIGKELHSQDHNDKLVKALHDSRDDEKKRITASKKVGHGENYNDDIIKGKPKMSPFSKIERFDGKISD